MKKIVMGILAIVVVGTVSGCESETKEEKVNAKISSTTTSSTGSEKAKSQKFETDNGVFSLKIPTGWEEIEPTELNDEADIALMNESDIAYFMVLSESKEDFVDYQAFKDLIVGEFDEYDDLVEEEISYNNFTGTRYTILTESDGVRFWFIHDIMEGNDYFIQNISWTIKSNQSKNESDMITIIESLEEVTD